MVTYYGANGDMGYSMTNEEAYRYLVLMTTISQDHFISLSKGGRDYLIKHRAWLCLMGLMETRDFIQ
ncbi:hypothetical protein LCGC14_1494220 [marine sediment metagenome]|uniref:Uncharacterized protein n=1 Tax=marine sediment metagenome TaxID=412755 RepID=A0A0F9LLE2_9ZZZZ